jgi:multisubunit Na+/H+ antiporter MnhC subunit
MTTMVLTVIVLGYCLAVIALTTRWENDEDDN